MTRPPLHHWFHCFADGTWQTPVAEHFDALTRYGLLEQLAGVHVGYVGSPGNIAAARAEVERLAPGADTVAESAAGWEQETLVPMWEWCRTYAHGFVSYAHTKGASRVDPIDGPWRRSMTYHCFVRWQGVVTALENGRAVAGCHWYQGGPSSVPGFGHGGMFGGNFWWTKAELLALGGPPGMQSRWHAEHWLGQLSEVTPLTCDTICDLNPGEVSEGLFTTDW